MFHLMPRFEVQIKVPKPQKVGQRVSILKVHTKNMMRNERLLVAGAPVDTTAAKRLEVIADNAL